MKIFIFIFLLAFHTKLFAIISTQNFDLSYEQSQKVFEDFTDRLVEKDPSLSYKKVYVPSEKDFDLSFQYFYRPGDSAEKLLILSSGVHGIEAYAGSAVVFDFLEQFGDKFKEKGISVAILHSLNPYGHKYNRRVTEANIDLNRNFLLEQEKFKTKSPEYLILSSYLNPEGVVSGNGFFDKLGFLWSMKDVLIDKGVVALRQAILLGQYEVQKGIYFGGKDYDSQYVLAIDLLQTLIASHKEIIHIDLHTGYGDRGELYLWGQQYIRDYSKALQKRIFPTSISSEKDDFYDSLGNFKALTYSLSSNEQNFVPITFEFGTLGLGFFSQLTSLTNMVWENQGYFYGYKNPAVEDAVKKSFLEMFNPSDEKWRESVIKNSREQFQNILKSW